MNLTSRSYRIIQHPRYLLVFYLILYNSVFFQFLQSHPSLEAHEFKSKIKIVENFAPLKKNPKALNILKDKENNNEIITRTNNQFSKIIFIENNYNFLLLTATKLNENYNLILSFKSKNTLVPRSPPYNSL